MTRRPPDGYKSARQARSGGMLLWLLLVALIAGWALFTWHPWVQWAGGHV
ncbi:MAG: hypothetical protein ACLPYS_18575 [Vulcanimicrobiaceae bacterium]